MHELVSYRVYVSDESLCYWRSASGFEVDFIIGDHTAVEVKAKENDSPQDVKSLKALAEEKTEAISLCEPCTEAQAGRRDCDSALQEISRCALEW